MKLASLVDQEFLKEGPQLCDGPAPLLARQVVKDWVANQQVACDVAGAREHKLLRVYVDGRPWHPMQLVDVKSVLVDNEQRLVLVAVLGVKDRLFLPAPAFSICYPFLAFCCVAAPHVVETLGLAGNYLLELLVNRVDLQIDLPDLKVK